MKEVTWNMRTLMRFGKLRGVNTIQDSVREMMVIVNLFSMMGESSRELTFEEIETCAHSLMACDSDLNEDSATELVVSKPAHVALVLTAFFNSLPNNTNQEEQESPSEGKIQS
jgi:hypothetical protein